MPPMSSFTSVLINDFAYWVYIVYLILRVIRDFWLKNKHISGSNKRYCGSAKKKQFL